MPFDEYFLAKILFTDRCHWSVCSSSDFSFESTMLHLKKLRLKILIVGILGVQAARAVLQCGSAAVRQCGSARRNRLRQYRLAFIYEHFES